MPFIRVTTNKKIEECNADFMRMEFGICIGAIEGKSEDWLMLEFKGEAMMAFTGVTLSCAMVEVDLFGPAKAEEKEQLTKSICQVVNVALNIPTNRIYVRYLETDTWGFDGHNF